MNMTSSWAILWEWITRIRRYVIFFLVILSTIRIFFYFQTVDRRAANPIQTISSKEMLDQEEKKLMAILYEPQREQSGEVPLSVIALRSLLCGVVGRGCSPEISRDAAHADSLFGQAGRLAVLPYKYPPASGIAWAKDTFEHIGIVPQTYAQGIGFNALYSFQPIWKVLRDVAYLIIVLVMLVVGFMIMFSIGGDGKGVTLEMALPKLVISLLAISLSYAIAGFMIDLMYISVIMVIGIFGPVAGMDAMSQAAYASSVVSGSPTSLFMEFVVGKNWSPVRYDLLADAMYTMVPGYMQSTLETIVSLGGMRLLYLAGSSNAGSTNNTPPNGIVNGAKNLFSKAAGYFQKAAKPIADMADALNNVGQGGAGTWAVSIISMVLYVILSTVIVNLFSAWILKSAIAFLLILGMIYLYFRLLVMIFSLYVDIVIAVIAAPIILMLEAIPGQDMLKKWITGLGVNLAVFPLMTSLFLVTRIIMTIGNTELPMWAPPFANSLSDQGSLQMIMAGIILYSIPQIVEAFRKKLGGSSMLGDLNIGVGSLLIGISPLTTAAGTVLGTTGIGRALSGSIADRIMKPFGFAIDRATGVFKKS